MSIDKLINWSELSRILTGNRTDVNKTRMPKKHNKTANELRHKRVNELRQKNQEWYDSLDPSEIKNKH